MFANAKCMVCMSIGYAIYTLLALVRIAIQLPTHFVIDVWKGRMNGWFENLQNPANKYHWWIFGIDQWLHQSIIITTVYFICG